ncbi:hypothetical protein ACFORO_19355 [Amycolatopsis halotolerans]|uniref:Secreted protein n=1 Tax=Amycolatopsis halotolerans TaxID=330083 RepID=A0ABV7QJ44_9PSEU
MRRAGALTAVAAGLLAAVPFVTGAAAHGYGCWTTGPIEVANEGVWKYFNRVSWCVQDAKITSVQLAVTHQVVNQACRWVGVLEQHQEPAKDGVGRTVYDRGEFSCPGTIGADGVNPWLAVTIEPDGTYTVDESGIHW